MILISVIAALTIAQILVVWLETDALIEYVKLFRLNKIIPHFEKYLTEEKNLNYKEYLRKNYNNFFVRMITCCVCFATFSTGILSFALALILGSFGILFLWLPTAYLSLILYKIYTRLSKN